MIQKKICMLGSFAVGKTSLVSRFVHSIFSDKYLTTLGVKIDKTVVYVDGNPISLVVWDVQGEDQEQRILPAYLRGMAGYLLVVDPTRQYTLENALLLKMRVEQEIGPTPFVLALNKADLKSDWHFDEDDLRLLESDALAVVETSAKTGSGVEECFQTLALEFVPLQHYGTGT
ncbi:MAG: Rab family GTPase [Pseudomonadales bacterium]